MIWYSDKTNTKIKILIKWEGEEKVKATLNSRARGPASYPPTSPGMVNRL